MHEKQIPHFLTEFKAKNRKAEANTKKINWQFQFDVVVEIRTSTATQISPSWHNIKPWFENREGKEIALPQIINATIEVMSWNKRSLILPRGTNMNAAYEQSIQFAH